MLRFALCRVLPLSLATVWAASFLSAPVAAIQPTEAILPSTTKGWVSTDNVDETRRKFQQTELGAMTQDPLMKPFIDDLKQQLYRKIDEAGKGFVVRWEDLEGVYGGEVCLCRIQPDPKNKDFHVLGLVANIVGKDKEADELLVKIDAQQKKEGAAISKLMVAGVEMLIYTQQPRGGKVEKNCLFRKGGFLAVFDDLETAKGVAGRIGADAADSLAKVEAFRYCMDRNTQEAGSLKQDVRWYLEPFGYAEIVRAMRGHNKKDMLAILYRQGFSAIQGFGGYVFLSTGKEEILHRTYVYAPPVKRLANDRRKDKWNLAMRMLDFPNGGVHTPQPWVKSDIGVYLNFNWKMQDAFRYSETLIDAVSEQGVFRDMWDGLRDDRQGPQIDIYKELINLLGERVTLLSDVLQPVTTTSERTMFILETKDPKTVANTLRKFFKNDPDAKERIFEGHVIWEIVPSEDSAANDGLMLEIEGGAFVAAAADDAKKPRKGEEEEERKLPRMATSVVDGNLVISTHRDYIEDLIRKTKSSAAVALGQFDDYTRVHTALVRLGSAADSLQFFGRTEESYRATYEMIRQNKLPQTESMLARIVNAAYGHDNKAGERKHEIDGSKLPPYEQVTKYLGPTGLYMQTEDNGWYLVGCLLTKKP